MELPAEFLENTRLELESAGDEATRVAGDLADEQLWWRPKPDRWSVGECLEHLVKTDEAYLDELDRAIERGRREGRFADGPVKRTLMGRALRWILEPPPRLRLPAPGAILPEAEPGSRAREDPPSRADPLARFLDLRGELVERIRAAEGLDLGRIEMPSPFYSFIRFDLGSAFRMIAAHERRHLWQARQVRENDVFPRT